ncbi:MAG: hypothetical protein RIE08_05805 [Acidimicrobiales bacterium]
MLIHSTWDPVADEALRRALTCRNLAADLEREVTGLRGALTALENRHMTTTWASASAAASRGRLADHVAELDAIVAAVSGLAADLDHHANEADAAAANWADPGSF